MNEAITIRVTNESLSRLIYGVSGLADGLCDRLMSDTIAGVLGDGTLEDQGLKARDFLAQNYEAISGGITLIAAAADILAIGLANGDIRFAEGGEGVME